MGTDDLFKKRREDRKKRNYAFKLPKVNSFLIVTEGERTEPLYFNGIKDLIQLKIGGNIDVIEIPTIEIHGEGRSTGSLIDKTDEIVKKAKIIYQNVWVVFDKDDFNDFDQAISTGIEKGYKVAWSNQSFEYWIYLHFHYSDTALHRNEWNKKLDEIFRQNNLKDGKYKKNYQDIYQLLSMHDGINTAVKNAKRRMSGFKEGQDKPSEYDPGTIVYRLVEELQRYLEN